MKKFFLLTFSSLLIFVVSAQQKLIQAIKINQPIKIDSNLDDAAWANVQPVSDFIITSPIFGGASSKKTSVKITYDNTAVYIGAYMYDDLSDIKKRINCKGCN